MHVSSNEKFQQTVVVEKHHTDELHHVNNVVYLQWIQDIAKKHWNSLAPKEIKQQFVWVVVRHEIDYKRPCVEGDELEVKTQVADDLSGATWGRHVWIVNQGKVAVQSFTRWCMIDVTSGKPARINSEISNVFYGK